MFKSTNEDIPITFQWLDELDILVKSNQIKTFQSIKSKFEDVKRQMISVKEGKINANNFDKFVKSKQFQSSLDPTNQKYFSFYSVLL
jgi:hypothetical protein